MCKGLQLGRRCLGSLCISLRPDPQTGRQELSQTHQQHTLFWIGGRPPCISRLSLCASFDRLNERGRLLPCLFLFCFNFVGSLCESEERERRKWLGWFEQGKREMGED